MDVRPLEQQIACDLAAIVGRLSRALDEIALATDDRDRAAKLITTRDVLKAALTAFSD